MKVQVGMRLEDVGVNVESRSKDVVDWVRVNVCMRQGGGGGAAGFGGSAPA